MKGRGRVACLLAISILSGAVWAAPDSFVVQATSTTQQQIKDKENEKENIKDKLDQEQDNLEGLKGEQGDLQKELKNLNANLSQVVANLEDLEQQVLDKEAQIQETQAALEEARETEKWQQECMVDRVRLMYENRNQNVGSALLKEKSLSDMLNAADYYESIAAYEQKMLEEFKANRILIEEQEARLVAEKAELDNLKAAAEAEKSRVAGLISQTSNSIAQYAGQISEAEQRALQYEADLKKAEEDLEARWEKLRTELALSQAAANATWRDISEVNFAEDDLYLLANLIYCEAGGEPYAGQLAVGSVVINRVLSSKYPDTVLGVIYQNKQFSPVASGRLALALAENKATPKCYQAAQEAMSGVTNVGTCVYFRTPIEGLTGINIGGHVFY